MSLRPPSLLVHDPAEYFQTDATFFGRPTFIQCWHWDRNGVWGRRCDEADFSEEKRLFTESQQGIQWMKASIGKEFYRKGNSVQRSGPFSESPGFKY